MPSDQVLLSRWEQHTAYGPVRANCDAAVSPEVPNLSRQAKACSD